MIWALFFGLSWGGDGALDQARAELAVLIAETEDPVLLEKLQSIHDQLGVLEPDSVSEGDAAPEVDPVPEEESLLSEEEPAPEEEPLSGPGGAAEASVSTAPAPDPVQQACSLQEFGQLRASVEQQAFSRDKIALVEKAGTRLHFSVEQLVGLLDVLDFGADKVQAAAILHPRLVDPQDFDRVYEVLVFDTDREALKALVEDTTVD